MKTCLTTVCAFLLFVSTAIATPLEYHVQLTVSPRFPGAPSHPVLTGAELHLRLSWDHSLLTPTHDQPGHSGSFIDWSTNWPTTNTAMSVEVVGTPSSDGVFVAWPFDSFEYGLPWSFGRADDKVLASLPNIEFDFHGEKVWISQIVAGYTHEGSMTTIFPRPYVNSDVTFVNDEIMRSEVFAGAFAMHAENISGYARLVPEPSALALGGITLTALAALRRRK